MKITVEHHHLHKALNIVQAIVAGQKRTAVPILTHVMIVAADNICTLITTDLDMQVKYTLPAIVIEAGQITVPAQLLFGITRSLPDGSQIDLTLAEDGQLALVSGKSQFMLHTMPADDFPDFDAGKFPHSFSLPATDLRTLIEKTRFAISTDETRYYLNGIYFHVPKKDKQNFRAVATDGYRLALCDVALPKEAGSIPGMIVPRKTVSEIYRFIENSEADLTISLSKTMIQYSSENITLTSKIIDGTFPDYARIIPEKNDKVLTISNKDLTKALQRVSSVFADSSPMVTPLVKLVLEKNQLSISGVCSGRGSAQEEMAIAYDDKPIEIGFNPDYLIDIVECINQEACIKIASSDIAALLCDAKKSDVGQSLYVLMPMRV